MDSAQEFHALRAALEWQIELGATEAIGDVPINRFDLPEKVPSVARPTATAGPVKTAAPQSMADHSEADPVLVARKMAQAAGSLGELAEAQARFDLCELKRGAKNTVFADGNPDARIMVIGEAPGRDEDLEGRPFVGRAGQLLDRMFAAIGMARNATLTKNAIYITNILPWRPPQNRDPLPTEIAMMLPFVQRHIELAKPEMLVLMGNVSCLALLGTRGITRLRGTWTQVAERPALPMFHPAYLLRNPAAKREAWADLLSLQAHLEQGS